MVVEERIGPVGDFPWLGSVLYSFSGFTVFGG